MEIRSVFGKQGRGERKKSGLKIFAGIAVLLVLCSAGGAVIQQNATNLSGGMETHAKNVVSEKEQTSPTQPLSNYELVRTPQNVSSMEPVIVFASGEAMQNLYG